MMMRPSNSGTATWVATSSGLMPSSLSCHCDRELVRHSPCRIGISSAARCATFQVSSLPPAETVAGTAPPAASTVVTIASADFSRSSMSGSAVRSEAQYTGSARPPASSIALHSAST